jgi:hypothetical protein
VRTQLLLHAPAVTADLLRVLHLAETPHSTPCPPAVVLLLTASC